MIRERQDLEKIILLGAGGHAKTIIDTLERNGDFEILGFIEHKQGRAFSYRGYSIIGTDDELGNIYQKGIQNAIVSVGFLGRSTTRQRLYSILKEVGYNLPTIIDSTAYVAPDAVIGEGTYIGRNAVVNVDTRVGKMCIVNTAAIVEHDCFVGDFSHIAVGAVVCGGVAIGKNCLVGANATVLQQKMVGDETIIGAGAVVTRNIPGRMIFKTD